MSELLRAKDVAGKLKIAVSTVWTWTREGRLPAPAKMGTTTVWHSDQIEQFMREVTAP